MPNPKIATMTLTTEIRGGNECVARQPSKITTSRGDADVIRLVNGNPAGSGQAIEVELSRSEAIKLFDPIPASQTTLDPGDTVDWTVKAVISGIVAVKFGTDPDKCTGGDQDDITVRC